MTSEYDEILNSLEELQSRVRQLQSEQLVSSEKKEIAEEGEFASTTITAKDSATVERSTVEICDFCHKKLETATEDFAVCIQCKKKLCKRCSIEFQSRVICPDDLRRIYPLSRDQFKVAWMISNGIEKTNDIHNITGISKNAIREIKNFLLGADYACRHGFFGFCLTSAGTEAFFCILSVLWQRARHYAAYRKVGGACWVIACDSHQAWEQLS